MPPPHPTLTLKRRHTQPPGASWPQVLWHLQGIPASPCLDCALFLRNPSGHHPGFKGVVVIYLPNNGIIPKANRLFSFFFFVAGRIHFSQHLSTQVGLEYYCSYKLKWQEMDPVCLSPSKEGWFPGDLLAEPQVEAGATFLEAELPGGWWQVCRVLGNVWDGALVSGHSSSGIRILTPSSMVPVEGESLQWVSAHDLLVLMVPPGEGNHLGSFSLQDHIQKRKSVSVE